MKPVFGIVEALFAFQLGLRGPRKPDADVVADFYDVAQVLDSKLCDLVAAKKVDARRGAIARLLPKSVVLTDGSEIPCDILVCATGFSKSYDHFSPEVRNALKVENDGLYLYRNALPTGVRNLAFVGSELATISNVSTYGLVAEWVARAWSGKMQLPPRAQQEQAVEQHKAWARSWMPETASRSSLVLLHQTHYHDTILRDMNENPRRKSNALAELFMPYESADYSGVIGTAK
jgi:dimethylaniline monooxygenase (N-oxide forming)